MRRTSSTVDMIIQARCPRLLMLPAQGTTATTWHPNNRWLGAMYGTEDHKCGPSGHSQPAQPALSNRPPKEKKSMRPYGEQNGQNLKFGKKLRENGVNPPGLAGNLQHSTAA